MKPLDRDLSILRHIYSMKDTSALRFESSDTAGELLDLCEERLISEQMSMELPI